MAILVKCRCGEQFQTNDANAGRSANCPDCGGELQIPNPRQGSVARAEDHGGITSGKAITSLILGVMSLFCVALTGIPAVLYGLKAIVEINRDRGLTRGRGIATTGIVLGVFGSTVMTVVAVIPLVERFRESIAHQQCMQNLKQIGLALHNANDARGRFVPWAIQSKSGQPLLSWRVALLNFMGPAEKDLYKQFHLDEPWDSPHNITLVASMPRIYWAANRVPKRAGETHYQAILGKGTMFSAAEGVAYNEVTDGTSNTFFVVEALKPVIWTKPDDWESGETVDFKPLMGHHPKGSNFLFADGSVRFIVETIKPAVLKALLTRDGGEVINANDF